MSYKTTKDTVRKYYKYKGMSWTQPILTANGTMGGAFFAVSASTEYNSSYSAYKAFDNSTSTDWATAGTHIPSWITFYNPSPLKVSLLTLRNRHDADNTGEVFLAGNIYGSNDNSNWDLLTPFTNSVTEKDNLWTIDLSNNTSFYKYYKIEGTSFNGTNQGFSNIAITAVEQVPSGIPSSYMCLSSITGGRFDSNIQMTHTTSIEAETALIANDTNWQYLIDNGAPSGSWFIVGKEQTSGPFTCHFLSNFWSLGVNPTVNQFYHFFVDMSATTKRFYIDNVLKLDPSDSSTGNFGNTLLLNHSKYKSKYFKIYNSDMELEHHIVPVKRVDGKLGWYDIMTDIFYSDSFKESITAYEELEYEDGTPSDYDFYEDIYICKAVEGFVREYYKSWVKPVLTSAGTMGGDSFAVAQSSSLASRDFWLLFSSSGGYWHSDAGHPQWVSWYNPEPLKVTKIFIGGHPAGNLKHFKVQASNDNLNWIDLKEVENTIQTANYEVDLSNNTNFYLYYRLYITSSYYGSYDLIDGFNMTAVFRGTPSDYDFYEDISIYKVVQKANPTPTGGNEEKNVQYYAWISPDWPGAIGYTQSSTPAMYDDFYRDDGYGYGVQIAGNVSSYDSSTDSIVDMKDFFTWYRNSEYDIYED